ncbi:MAG: hypothetical protein EBT07_17580 [Actinobacteria bacterium]|nr:hypothetical protein [Actinomycetota bacterium]
MDTRFNIDEFDRSIRSDAPLYPTDWDADWDEPTEPPHEHDEIPEDDDTAVTFPYPDEPWDDEEVAD